MLLIVFHNYIKKARDSLTGRVADEQDTVFTAEGLGTLQTGSPETSNTRHPVGFYTRYQVWSSTGHYCR